MLCGYLPFEDPDNDLLFQKISNCEPEFPDELSDDAIDLMKKIMVNNPDERITIPEIKKHPFYLKGKKHFESIHPDLVNEVEIDYSQKDKDNNNNDYNCNDELNINKVIDTVNYKNYKKDINEKKENNQNEKVIINKRKDVDNNNILDMNKNENIIDKTNEIKIYFSLYFFKGDYRIKI